MYNYSYLDGHKGHPHYIRDHQIKTLRKSVIGKGEEKDLLTIIRNLSDPTKFKIYLLLHKVEDVSVTGISDILKISQSAVSHALIDLKNIGLIKSYRCGQLVCYALIEKNRRSSNYIGKFANIFGGFGKRKFSI